MIDVHDRRVSDHIEHVVINCHFGFSIEPLAGVLTGMSRVADLVFFLMQIQKQFRRPLRWLCALLFDGAKSRQKLLPRLHRPATPGLLQCSMQAGRKELAALKHLFASFRLPLRASAAHTLTKFKDKILSCLSSNELAHWRTVVWRDRVERIVRFRIVRIPISDLILINPRTRAIY